MIDVRHERVVTAAPDEVWRVLGRFDALAEWAESIDHSSRLGGPDAGTGAARRVQTGSLVIVEVVTAWEPGVRLAYELQGLPPFVTRVVNEWTIEGQRDETLVALVAHITPGPRAPMRFASRVLARRLGATNEGLLADLARAVTSRVSGGT